MPFDIQTADGITVTGIPDGTPDEAIKARIQNVRATRANQQFVKDAAKPTGQLNREHGVNPAEDMPGYMQFGAGYFAGLKKAGMGVGQLMNMVSREDVDRENLLTQGLEDTGAGMTGSIVGQAAPFVAIPGGAAASAVGRVAPTAGRVLAGGTGMIVGGGLQGAASPVGTEDSRVSNAALGAVTGGLFPATAAAFKALGRTLEPFYEGGRTRLIARQLVESADDPAAAAQRMAGATERVPGSRLTAAEASGDPGLLAVERSARAGPGAAQFAARDLERNATRVGELQDVAGTEQSRAAARSAREQGTRPLRDEIANSTAQVDPRPVVRGIDRVLNAAGGERDKIAKPLADIRDRLFEPYPLPARATDAWHGLDDIIKSGVAAATDEPVLLELRVLMNRVRTGKLTADDALESLKTIKTRGVVAQGALDDIKSMLKMADTRLKARPEQLYGVRQQVTDMIDARDVTGKRVNASIDAHLQQVRQALDDVISRSEPAYPRYRQAYSAASPAVTGPEAASRMLTRFEQNAPRGPGGEMVLGETERRAINRSTEVRGAGGRAFQRYSPGDEARVAAVGEDIASQNAYQRVRPIGGGDPNAQVRSDILRGLTSGAASMAGHPVAALAVTLLNNPATRATSETLARMLMSPTTTAAAMQRVLPRNVPSRTLMKLSPPEREALAEALRKGTAAALTATATSISAAPVKEVPDRSGR